MLFTQQFPFIASLQFLSSQVKIVPNILKNVLGVEKWKGKKNLFTSVFFPNKQN